jgi:SPP1 gp7 family putative phage head morphogenesis protein
MASNWDALCYAVQNLFEAQRGDELQYLVARFVEGEFYTPATQFAKQQTLKAYYAGQTRARATLKGIGVGAQVGPLPPDPQVLSILNNRNISAIMGINDELAKRVKESLTTGILKGEGMERLAERLSEDTSIPITRARIVARTETMYAFNNAALTEFERFGIHTVEWLTAEDERTCKRCGPLNHKVFKMGQQPDCPLHPNCRCTLEAILEEL